MGTTISREESNRDVTISVPEIRFPSSSPILSQASTAGYQPSRNTKPISEIKAKKCTEYRIELPDYTTRYGCDITGMSITPDGRRLLANCRNSMIQMFSRHMQIISSLSLPAPPWDIAVTGDREAVVTVPVSKLFILDISWQQMSIRQTVKLSFLVYGIETYKDKLVVTSLDPFSSFPASVKLIDRSGKIYWSTSTDHQGQPLFSEHWYVTCNDDAGSSTVIVTDEGNHTLTLLNSDTGDVISRQRQQGMLPRGVTTDTAGNVYVCYSLTREVAVLSRDFSEGKILLTERDGIFRDPRAIVYDAKDHQLLVSYWIGCNVVDCFQLL